MARVLVSEKLAQPGLDLMAAAGHEVDVQLGLSPEELVATIAGAHALVRIPAGEGGIAAGSIVQAIILDLP